MSIQKNPDKRDLRYTKLITGRMNGSPEDEIAANAECDSPIDLYRRLARDGFPVCRMCGATHVEEGHCEQEKRRKAGSIRGEAEELPPAKEAAPLFKEALNTLLDEVEFMQRDHERLSGRRYSKEYLQNGRFFQYTREEVHWAPGLARTRFTPARQSPGNGLTQLIAAYLLAYDDPEPLIEKLHPDPDSLDREKLRKQIVPPRG